MAKQKSILIRLVAALLIILLVFAGIALVLFSCTPRQLGLQGIAVTEKYTLDGLGLADVKVSEAYSLVKSLTKTFSRESFAPNAFSENDAVSCDRKFATLLPQAEGRPNYEQLIYASVTHLAPLTLTEKELAYVLDSALRHMYSSDKWQLISEFVEKAEVLKNLAVSVIETHFYQQDGKFYLQTVLGLDVSSYTQDINKSLGKYAISDTVYCTVVSEIVVKSDTVLVIFVKDGVLKQEKFLSVAVNDQPTRTSQTALDALLKLTAKTEKDITTSSEISTTILELVSAVCKHIGGIGTMDGLSADYGTNGINTETHQITFLP